MANDLQIRVLLSALDKVTTPLKRIAGGGNATARALKAARDRVKELNQQQQDISAYQRQREAVRQSAEALAKGQEKLRSYREQLKAMDAPSAAFQKTFANAAAAVDKLQAKHTAQRTELQRLLPIMRSAGVDTRNLGAAQSRLETQLSTANAAIEAQRAKLTSLNRLQERSAAVRAKLAKGQEFAGNAAVAGASSAATGAALGSPILGMIKSYSSFEDAMAGVAKQVDGARNDSGQLTETYYDMARAIQKMSETIPMATTDIAALVEGAARMGIQGKDDLLTFARTAATAATAFDLPADQIGEDLARIAGLYKLPIKNVAALGDAINYLDDNAQSKGGDIIEVLKRTAGITASVGMNYKDAAALGSTFLSLGSSAEVAGTATNAMIRELAIAEQQPKRFGKALKVLGLDASKIQKGMAKDATGTIQMVLTAINKLPQDRQIGVTTELFGKEYGDDAAKLANNLKEYQRQLDLVRGDKGAGSMQREGDIKGDLLSSQWKMSQNRAFNLSSDLGSTLRPALIELMNTLNGVLEKVNGWAKTNPELVTTLLKVGAGAAALAATFGVLALGLAGILGPMLITRFALGQIGIRLPNVIGLFTRLGRRELPATTQSMGLFARVSSSLSGIGQRLATSWQAAAIQPGIWTRARASLVQFGSSISTTTSRMGQAVTASLTWSKTLAGQVASGIKGAAQATANLAKANAQGLAAATSRTIAYVRANGLLGTSLNVLRGGWTGLVNVLRGAATGILGGAAAGLRLVGQAVLFLTRALLLNPIGLLVTALALGAVALIKYWEPVKAFFAGMWQGFKEGLAPLQPLITGVGSALAPLAPIWDSISAALGTAWGWVSRLFEPFKATSAELDTATSKGRIFGQWLAGLVNLIAGLPNQFVAMGGMLMDGLVNGITSRMGAVKDAVMGAGESVINFFKEKLDIHSPSRVFAALGEYTMQGLTVGLGKGEDGPLAQLMSTAKRLTAAGAVALGIGAAPMALAQSLPQPTVFNGTQSQPITFDDRPALPPAVPVVPSTGDHIEIHIHAGPAQDPQAIARQVRAELARIQAEKAARGRSSLKDRT